MGGIMDFFRGASSDQPVAQPAAAAPAAPTPPAANAQMPGSQQEPVNPLDAYAKLWEKDEKAGTENVAPAYTLDPAVLGDVSSKLNFTQDVPPELMQAATTGDANALLKIMNMVGQNSYKAAMAHNAALTDKFVGARTEHAMKDIGGKVKGEMTSAALSSVPNYKHPVIKRQLDEASRAFASQHPDATPDQIANMAVKYVQDLAAALNPESTESKQQAAGEVDWEKYFG